MAQDRRLGIKDLINLPPPSASSSSSSSSSPKVSATTTTKKMMMMDTADVDVAMASPRAGSSSCAIDEEDEKVRIAVRALGDMRTSGVPSSSSDAESSSQYWHHPRSPGASTRATPSLSRASTSSRATSPSTVARPLDDPDDDASVKSEDVESPDHLLARVSHLPLVNTALRAYDYSKASSRVINYGAGLVESSVKTISQPVISRLPVEQLDDFACRQLDRLGRYGGKPDCSLERRARRRSPDDEYPRKIPLAIEATSAADQEEDEGAEQKQVQVANRKGWQTVLVEASGISAAISEENMKRLKYCLQWLQYATSHVDHQIMVIQRFLTSLDSQMSGNPGALVPVAAMRTISDVKRDVVATVRQVVEVMSKYAGGSLPEPARATLRGFILLLPERWASAMQQQEAELQAQSAPTSGGPAQPSPAGLTASTAQQAAKRVLTLATESVEMMRGATGVFRESLDRADAWVDRLQVIGIQRQREQEQMNSNDAGLVPFQRTPNSPGVNIQGLSISSAYDGPIGSRRPSTSEPDEEDTETEGECSSSMNGRRGGQVRRRQRRRIASPSPAAAARLLQADNR
ncbi:hypothetical protein FRB97_001326 [Tulasnella sp. 331]|nr:hypothetical protein FRB97_001326 [Tulasnella sp. 331]KAG8889596.1 hypothetical protein FRB98_003658 [Tulasnella sp. 332]